MSSFEHISKKTSDDVTVADREQRSLQSTLADSLASAESGEDRDSSSVEAELKRRQLLQYESARQQSRILYVTSNPQTFTEDSVLRRHFATMRSVFDELHVLVLGYKTNQPAKTVRPEDNIWLYPTRSRGFWRKLIDGYKLAKYQLTFAEGFRPDIIVALDPFESAIVAYVISKRFRRPLQVHILENQVPGTQHRSWQLRFARFVLKRVSSVRTTSQTILDEVEQEYGHIEDIAVLPKFYNIRSLLDMADAKPDSNLYNQFALTLMAVGDMSESGSMYRILDATKTILQTPSIGLVVLGEGSKLPQLRERAELLGIAAQVIFKNRVDDLPTQLRAADVVLCVDVDEASDIKILKAAALGRPLVIARDELREDIFTDGVSALLFEPTNTAELTRKVQDFMNNNGLRIELAQNAPSVVTDRITEDPELYKYAYRGSVEAVLQLADTPVAHLDEAQLAATKESPEALEAPTTKVVDGVEMKLPQR